MYFVFLPWGWSRLALGTVSRPMTSPSLVQIALVCGRLHTIGAGAGAGDGARVWLWSAVEATQTRMKTWIC